MLAVPHTGSIIFHQCSVFVHLAFPIFSIEKLFLPLLLIHTVCVYVLVTQLCPTPCQAPLSMGFYKQEYWTGLPFPSLGDLSDPGIEPGSPAL